MKKLSQITIKQNYHKARFSLFQHLGFPTVIIGAILLFTSCKKEELVYNTSEFELGVAQILDPGNPLIAVYTDREGKEAISILGTKDPVLGSPLSFNEIIVSRETEASILYNSFELYGDGRPTLTCN